MIDLIEVNDNEKSFFIKKTPITVADWYLLGMNELNYWQKLEKKHPAIGFYHFDEIIEYCNRLEKKLRLEGKINEDYYVDIPQVQEWTYACMGDSKQKWSFGIDDKKLSEYAWYNANSNNRLQEVGKKKPNKFGLYDLYGNIEEWCHEGNYTKYDYKNNKYKVYPALGGAFDSILEECIINELHSIGETNQFGESVGFRVGVFPNKRNN